MDQINHGSIIDAQTTLAKKNAKYFAKYFVFYFWNFPTKLIQLRTGFFFKFNPQKCMEVPKTHAAHFWGLKLVINTVFSLRNQRKPISLIWEMKYFVKKLNI